MVKKVYRLEDKDGLGPYQGDQKCVSFINPHADPIDMIRSSGFPKELLDVLSKAGFVFGWSTLEKYSNYFRKNGKKKCEELGFKMSIYEPLYRYDFPDGQVMFSKSQPELNLIDFKTLLKIFSNISKTKIK